ncbi:hypothetical protein BYT27DRAFT_7221352 [Phlegmacium glaucopus]|nr:hypothetical protein BYT27DRAFT_7221352 [Phlegmacium glaucopus]
MKVQCKAASFNLTEYSSCQFYAPKCHPNTRTAESEHVLQLYGSAGAGKSPIVQTIAEMCAKVGLLVASFFFSRLFQSWNNEKHLMADPVVFDKSLDTQIEMLIIRPLENACAKWPRLIVIDGLDECHGPLIQSFIIRVLSTALLRIPVPLILLIASRPEPHIQNAFNILNKDHASRHIVLDDLYEPDPDINIFLLSRFEKIKENHPLAKSSGQFIHASTVMKYLDSPNHRPMKRLDVIIGLIPVGSDMSYKALLRSRFGRGLYTPPGNPTDMLKIFGFLICIYNIAVTPYFVADLLGVDEEDVHLCLSELHPILRPRQVDC